LGRLIGQAVVLAFLGAACGLVGLMIYSLGSALIG